MAEGQKMTVSRGLTRMKTILAQLENISVDIRSMGVWIDKEKHPLGDSTVAKDDKGLKLNHTQAIEKIRSLWQQHEDLTFQYVKIQTAINRSNDTTLITVGGRTLTVAEAKVIQTKIIGEKSTVGPSKVLNTSFQYAASQAERAVKEYNKQFANISNEEVKKPLLADILYLVDADKARQHSHFITEFLVEFNATLNEVNAVTEITI